MKSKRKPITSWRVKRIRGNKAEDVAVVPATDRDHAIKVATELYKITDPTERRRLIASRLTDD